jgi:hypothetical protein
MKKVVKPVGVCMHSWMLEVKAVLRITCIKKHDQLRKVSKIDGSV